MTTVAWKSENKISIFDRGVFPLVIINVFEKPHYIYFSEMGKLMVYS